MKKKIIIAVVVILVLVIISGITNYIDGGRVRAGVEPVCSIRIVSEDGNKVTYWGFGYKIIRYPSVSPNEPFKNNRGVKFGNWFMEYEPEEYSIVNVYYESEEETNYPEKIYEDDAHSYYLPYYKSENIIVEDSNKVRMNLKEALTKGKISMDILENDFDIKVIEEKKFMYGNEKSIANIPNVKFLANKTKEEVENALLGVTQKTIHELWGEADIHLSGLWGEHWMFDNDTQSIALIYAESSGVGVVQYVDIKANENIEKISVLEKAYNTIINAQGENAEELILFPETSDDYIEGLYSGLKDIKTKEKILYVHPIGMACEIALVEVENEDDIEKVEKIFKDRIEKGINAAMCDSASQDIWRRRAEIQIKDNCICMIVLPDDNVIPEDIFK